MTHIFADEKSNDKQRRLLARSGQAAAGAGRQLG